MDAKSYYLVLGIARGETARGIRAAYRALARKHHPDVAGEEGTRAFQEISEAYRVLSDPRLRRAYDERYGREEPLRSRAASVRPAVADPFAVELGPLSASRDFVRPSFDAMLERFQRNFTGRGVPKAERLESLDFDLVLTADEAARGGAVRVPLPVFRRCTECRGSGSDWLLPCLHCSGQGVIEFERAVDVIVAPMTRSGTITEVPLHGLGIHNLFLRLHVSIEA